MLTPVIILNNSPATCCGIDANFSSIAACLSTSLQSDVGRPNHLAPLSSGSFTMDDSASSLGPVSIEPDSLASHNQATMTCSRIIAALSRGTCSLAPGDLAKSEMQKSPVLVGPFRAFSLGGRPPARISYPQTCLSGNGRKRIALILLTHRCAR